MTARTLLITGVGSGLGAAFARAAIESGHRVVGTVRHWPDVGPDVGPGVRSGGGSSGGSGAAALRQAPGGIVLPLDLTDVAAIPAVVAEAEARMGLIDVLVNNAGFGHEGTLEESPLDALRRQLDVNVVAQVALMQAVLPGMRSRGRGHIVNVTSMAGTVGLPAVSFYCAAKFALEGISEALSKEVRPFGIHVTALAPGQFRTDWAGRSLERSPETIPDYVPIIGPMRAARRAKDGRQAGDPDKAAALLMTIIASSNPPARVFVGPDAVALAHQKVKRMQAELAAWEEASVATDHDVPSR